MAENSAGSAGCYVAAFDVEIGAADGGFGDFDDCIGGSGDLGTGTVFKFDGAGCFVYEGFHSRVICRSAKCAGSR